MVTDWKRAWAYGVTVVITAAVLLPLLGSPDGDSFPLSTYPMFSGLKSADASIPHVIGLTADGERVVLPPEAVANDEVIQAFETVRQAVRQGPSSTAALCSETAAWTAEHREDVVQVAVVTDVYDAAAYFDGDREPRHTTVHAECSAGGAQ